MKIKTIFKRFSLLLVLLSLCVPVMLTTDLVIGDAHAQSFRPVSLNVPLPGANNTTTKEIPDVTPGAESGYFLNYMGFVVTWVSGILGMICVGIFIVSGFQIMANFGNTEAVTQAKERILSTVFGLILLVTGALLLHTINPGFFRWGDDANPSNGRQRTIVVKTPPQSGQDCASVRETVKDAFYVEYEAVLKANGDKTDFRCSPSPDLAEKIVNLPGGDCEVSYTVVCFFTEPL